MECQPALRYHSPNAAERETTPVTVEWSMEMSEYSADDAIAIQAACDRANA